MRNRRHDDPPNGVIPERDRFALQDQSGTGAFSDILPEGSIIADNYRVLSLLGSGGMCHVYKCQDMSLNRFVALKMLRSEISANQNAVLRFQREGQAVAQINHPNIVRVHSLVTTSSGQPCMVMEIVAGTPLSELVATRGGLQLFQSF